MTISTQKKVWTDDELLALPDDTNKYEVLDGELIVSPAGSVTHGVIIMRILIPLGTFVNANSLGQLLEGQSGFRMLNSDFLVPDISFVARDRWEAGIKTEKTFFPGAPDLLVEVLSPSDRPGRTKKRIARLFQNGTRLAWVVDPPHRTVQVYHSAEPDSKLLTAVEALDGEDVVAGFKLPLSQIFK
jgi:Uma2 family endonuclease